MISLKWFFTDSIPITSEKFILSISHILWMKNAALSGIKDTHYDMKATVHNGSNTSVSKLCGISWIVTWEKL